MRAALRIVATLALCCAIVTALACFTLATAAQAAPRTIAGYGKGAGKVRRPVGVAVHQSGGELYVADNNNKRVLEFDSEGNFRLAWGFGVRDGLSAELQTCGPAASPPAVRCFTGVNGSGAGSVIPEAVAVEQSSGDVFVADSVSKRVSKFSPQGEFLFMVGKEVNKTDAANICTAADLTEGDECGAGLAGSGPNEFSAPISLALDAAGNVWVGDANRLAQFGPEGAPGAEIALPSAGATKALALNSEGDFYVKSASLAGIRKLEAGTGTLLKTLDVGGAPEALAVDGADNVYVGDKTIPYRFMVFDPAGEQTSQFGAGQVIGAPGLGNGVPGNALAIDDSAKTLYVASSRSAEAESAVQAFPLPEPGPLPEDQHVTNLLPSTATLAASLNPEGHATKYHFEYGTSEAYGGETPEQALAGTGFDSEAVEAELEELTPATIYHFRLVATNHCNPAEPAEECTVAGPDTTFTTRTAVGIEAQWATGVAARSATVHAELDPLGVVGHWWLEYGTSPCAEGGCAKSAEAALPGSFGPVAVAVALSGLQPGTAYHYRFAARDERGGVEYTVHGEDRGFTTQPGGLDFELADQRAWEMVSPAQKFGGGIEEFVTGLSQAAAGGEGLAYLSRGSVEADPEGNRSPEDSSVLARRGAGGVWSSQDITPPHRTVTPAPGFGLEYKLFSPELGRAVFEQRDTAPLVPEATERTPYVRENSTPPIYTPLLTGANALPGFGGDPENKRGAVGVQGASADLTHVVLGSKEVSLLAGAAEGSLYMWEAGGLEAVSLLPGGEAGKSVTAELGSGEAALRHAISEDGSRVFFSSGAGLYVRDLGRGETARLDVVQPGGPGSGGASPVFQGADSKGTVAFFTDSQNLTADAGEEGRDLYRCQVIVEGGELGCELTDISANGGESAEVQGLVAGMSEDGTHAYFVARGVLDPAPNGEEDVAVTGQPNLYAWQAEQGTRFVAKLSGEDSTDWGFTDPSSPLVGYKVTAMASPDGRYLAFMSERPLTGYDNRDAGSGTRAQEVFRYDAGANGGEGELSCASCNPAGARPRALVPGSESILAKEFDPLHLWDGRAVAAVLPEASVVQDVGSLYRSRAVHDDGRVFFNAADALVAADSNGNGDVYQYEPPGTGSCSASSGDAGTARVAGGCVSLISSGAAAGTASFLDASESGDDVFFYTPAQLAVTDVDQVIDVYDARVNGTPATLSPSAECQGEACQPPAVAAALRTPSSESFQGPGNLRPPAAGRRCAKGKRKVGSHGKARCAKRHKRAHARHRHDRRAHRNGRGQR